MRKMFNAEFVALGTIDGEERDVLGSILPSDDELRATAKEVQP